MRGTVGLQSDIDIDGRTVDDESGDIFGVVLLEGVGRSTKGLMGDTIAWNKGEIVYLRGWRRPVLLNVSDFRNNKR